MENLSRKRDQFYTQREIALECVNYLLDLVKVEKNTLFLEPSAGEGSFLFPLIDKKLNFLALDIEPKHNEIREADFLNYDTQNILNNSVITLGNPPFGKNSSLAIKFFNKAAEFSNYIAMILPATFEKDSIKNRLSLNMKLIKSIKLSSELFSLDGKLVNVPTVFQIWKKDTVLREKVIKKTHSDYLTFTTRDKADIAIQRVGNAAGKIKREFSRVASASHYFIALEEKYLSILENIDWSSIKYNTAGNPSISKREIIELFEKNIC